jgi:hypothetical protein
MPAMTRRGLPLLVLLVVCTAVPAWAHGPVGMTSEAGGIAITPPVSWRAMEAPPEVPGAVLLIALAVAAAAARRPRRALARILVLGALCFAFENGVHAVHHLNDPDQDAKCAIASASAQVAGTLVDGAPTGPVALSSSERLVVEHRPDHEDHSRAAHQGRAPPLAT